jgi:hypothetical protein
MSANPEEPSATAAASGSNDPVIDAIRSALENLRYGHVALTIHEGRIVQLDVTEKKRFSST